MDTSAGPNFIHKDELRPEVRVVKYGPRPDLADTNNHPIKVMGLVELVVRLGTRVVRVEFILCERLAAPMILGCDLCERFFEEIYPLQKAIKLDDGTTVPIVRRPLKRAPKMAPLPPSQRYGKANGCTSPKVRFALKTQLPPESQTWVTVTSERHRMVVLQP